MQIYCDNCAGYGTVETLGRHGFSGSYCHDHSEAICACDYCGEEADLFDFDGDEVCRDCIEGLGETADGLQRAVIYTDGPQ